MRKRGGSEREHGEEKMDYTVKEVGSREGKQVRFKEQLEEAQVGSTRKSSPKGSSCFGFTQSLAKPKMEKEAGRQRAR